MKLKSLSKTGFLTISLGIALLTSATPTFASDNLVFRTCLIQCLEEICQEESSPLCRLSHSSPSVDNLFCRGMPGSPYNPIAMLQPSCIKLNFLNCKMSCTGF